MARPRDGEIGVGTALSLTGLLVVATLAVAAVAALIGMVSRGTPFEDALEGVRTDPLLASLAQLGGAGVAIAVGVSFAHGEVRLREALSVAPVPSAVGMLALTAGLALAFPLREIAQIVAEIAPRLAPDPAEAMAIARRLRIESVADAFVVPLAFVAIPAVAEELFFRGLVLPGLAKRIDPKLAIAVTAILFGLVHLSPIAILYGSLAGAILGWVRLSTGSVVPCIALHGAFNAMPILLPAELIRLRGFNTVEPGVYHLPLALVIGSSLVTFSCLAVIARFTDEDE